MSINKNGNLENYEKDLIEQNIPENNFQKRSNKWSELDEYDVTDHNTSEQFITESSNNINIIQEYKYENGNKKDNSELEFENLLLQVTEGYRAMGMTVDFCDGLANYHRSFYKNKGVIRSKCDQVNVLMGEMGKINALKSIGTNNNAKNTNKNLIVVNHVTVKICLHQTVQVNPKTKITSHELNTEFESYADKQAWKIICDIESANETNITTLLDELSSKMVIERTESGIKVNLVDEINNLNQVLVYDHSPAN